MRGALVTGASSGIGRATAIRLAEENWVVAACGRSAAALEAAFGGLAADVRSRIIVCGAPENDLASEAGCRATVAAATATFEATGALFSLLFNNAGGGSLGVPLDAKQSTDVFDATLALDLRAPWILTALCAPALSAAWPDGSAAIVNVSSVCGQRPMVGLGAYCVAKAGLEMLTKQAALEFAGRVRVNCVAPATIVTDFHARAGMSAEQAAAYYASIAAAHPVGRVGQPADIAELVLFLADSRKSSFITGAILNCDGGRLLPVPAAGQLSLAAAPACK